MPLQGNVSASSASTLTLTSANSIYVYTGSAAATWTLPAISGNSGELLVLYNRGTATVTVAAAGSDQIDSNGALTTSAKLTAGSSFELIDDGTYWLVVSSALSPLPTYDNSVVSASHQSGVTSGAAVTWTHAVGAGTPYGIVVLHSNTATTPSNTTAAVTFGGVTLTQVGFIKSSSNSSVWMFGGSNIPSGSQTVSATLTSGSTSIGFTGTSYTYFNVATLGTFSSSQAHGGHNSPIALPFVRSSPLPARFFTALTESTASGSLATLVNTNVVWRQYVDPGGSGSLVTSCGGDIPLFGADATTCITQIVNDADYATAGIELLGQTPAGPYINGVGPAPLVLSGGSGGNTFTQEAVAGTYALVVVYYLQPGFGSGSLGTVTYGGTAMTQLATAYPNNDTTAAKGQLFVFGLANVTGGTQTVSLTYTGGVPSDVIAAAATYYGVSNVTVSATNTGSGTSLTQSSVPCSPVQLAVQAFVSYGTDPIVYTDSSVRLASARTSDHGSLGVTQRIATSTPTATVATSNPWAGIALILS